MYRQRYLRTSSLRVGIKRAYYPLLRSSRRVAYPVETTCTHMGASRPFWGSSLEATDNNSQGRPPQVAYGGSMASPGHGISRSVARSPQSCRNLTTSRHHWRAQNLPLSAPFTVAKACLLRNFRQKCSQCHNGHNSVSVMHH